MRACIILLAVYFAPHAAMACGRIELRVFIEAAQQLSERTEQLGQRLLTCPGESIEASQWLSFYRTLQVQPGRPTTFPIAPRIQVPGEVGKAIAKAYNGSYTELQTKLDAGDPIYRETPEAPLAVARMLIREQRFREGRAYYEDSLRIRDNSIEAVEYLYTYIWEGDLERADEELSSARGDSYLTAAVERGRRLVQALRGRQATTRQASRSMNDKPLLTGAVESFVIKDQLRRYGSLLHYQGIVDASWYHDVIAAQVYDEPSLNTDELRLGHELKFGERVTLAGHASYVVHAKRHWAGAASVRFFAPAGMHLTMGGERRFLYRNTPLPKDSLGLTQDEQWLGIGWRTRIDLRIATLKDSDSPRFERYELHLHHPLSRKISALARLGYETRIVASPNYETYRKTQLFALGANFKHSWDSDWELQAEAVYSLRVRQSFGDERFWRHSGIDLRTEASTRLVDHLRAAGQLFYSGLETSRPTGNFEQRLTLLAALQWLP